MYTQYSIDWDGLLEEIMPPILQSRLPEEIKDSWIELSVEHSIQQLHEPVVIV